MRWAWLILFCLVGSSAVANPKARDAIAESLLQMRQEPAGPEPLSQREIDDLLRQFKEGSKSPDDVMDVFRSRRNQKRELQEMDAQDALHGPPPNIDQYGIRPPPLVIPPENQRRPNKRNIWDY